MTKPPARKLMDRDASDVAGCHSRRRRNGNRPLFHAELVFEALNNLAQNHGLAGSYVQTSWLARCVVDRAEGQFTSTASEEHILPIHRLLENIFLLLTQRYPR